ncbi:MAG: hypothetical protein MJ252_14990 [archaeon]|nr:hypothetical protein [archaeon]
MMKSPYALDQITATSLLEDLKSQDTKVKINALNNLRGISFALGRERTRKELLPFLSSCIEEEEDETLVQLAKVLSNFIDCIGGKEYVKELLNILEQLLCVDESNIRNEAINTLKAIQKEINNFKLLEDGFMEMINRLGSNESENQIISCINLICFTYNYFSEKNKNLCREFIKKFSTHPSLNIKKELGDKIMDIMIYLPSNLVIYILENTANDNNDNIKMKVMDLIIASVNHPNLNDICDTIIKNILKFNKSENWRLRIAVGDKLTNFLEMKLSEPNKNKMKESVIEIAISFLSDKEPELRNIICLKLDTIAKVIGQDDQFNKIFENLKPIITDSTSYVRGALSSTLLKLCPIIGLKKTNEFIIPIFLEMLKDENHDIRMSLIKGLEDLNKVIKIDEIVQSIIPSIIDINSNKSWRIRIQIMEVIPTLSKLLDKNVFLDKIFVLCIPSLTDPVFAIREAACKLIKDLYPEFMSSDFDTKICDKLKEMSVNSSYLVRNTAALFILGFCDEEKDIYQKFVEDKLSQFVFKLSKDKISNVRMNCASCLIKMKKFLKDKKNEEQANECIKILKTDSDPDVKKNVN